ncbi:MAG: hypothetical protein WDO18_00780 [Acidobacteriota bacterium]
MERTLARQRPVRFQEVAELPGVIRSLVHLFGEAAASRLPEDLRRLFSEVERELAHRGFAPQRVRMATLGEVDEIEVHLDSSAPVRVVRTTNMEREVEEVAAHILDEAAQGRPFREMAIVLRSRDPYEPLVATALARFGIPFRSYFTGTLDKHPYVQYLSTICRAALNGWDRELLLHALRMPASGLGGTQAGDDLDFAIRKQLPASGWQ